MSWKISYMTQKGRVNFNEDPGIGCPIYKPQGEYPEEAIKDVQDYLIEIYGCNCLEAKWIPGGLEIHEPSDKELVETYSDFSANKTYALIDSNGKAYESETPGQFGGHRKLRIYGRLDCPSALRHIDNGEYVKYRVFFGDEATAIAAGYRPCGVCMKHAYTAWKEEMSYTQSRLP